MLKKISFLIILISIITMQICFSSSLGQVKADPNASLRDKVYLEKIIKAENSLNKIFGIHEPFYSELSSRVDGILKMEEISKVNLKDAFPRKVFKDIIINLNQKLSEEKKIFAYSDAESLNTEKFKKIYDTKKFSGNNLNNGEYRYAGINFLGERVVNPTYPYDTDGVSGPKGRQLNDKKWIKRPWDKKLVKKNCPDVSATRFDFLNVKNTNPELLDELMKEFIFSMEEEHGKYFNPSLVNKDEWVKYIHVTTPHSEYSKGIARLWHEVNGTLWYIDVVLNDDITDEKEITVRYKDYENNDIIKEEILNLNEIDGEISKENFNEYRYIGSQILYDGENKNFEKGKIEVKESYLKEEIDETKEKIIIEFYYEKEKTIEETRKRGSLKAMSRGHSFYDVLKGIPVTDELYSNLIVNDHITNYNFEKLEKETNHKVIVKRTYIEVWYSDGDRHTITKTVIMKYNIKRSYKYYFIDYFESFKIKTSKVLNNALENNEIIMLPRNYDGPKIEIEDLKNIIYTPPKEKTITLSTKTVGLGETPESPNWKSYAENGLEKYKVRNDKLLFNDKTIMDSKIKEKETNDPTEVPKAKLIDKNTLYEPNITIPKYKRNLKNESKGIITYEKIAQLNSTSPNEIKKEIQVNPVTVHTPMFSECQLSTIGDNYNQEINSNIDDRALILGMPSIIRYKTTGKHRNILGYEERDYNRYIKKKEIKIPFDLYINTNKKEIGKFVKKNTWTEITKLDTNIYLPKWVDEGTYTIETKTTAINSQTGDKIITRTANLNRNEYIIRDEMKVKVIGRLYGLKITDIYDYPTWEEVFREKEGSYKHIEGHNYPVGYNDENGNQVKTQRKYFQPIIPGSHLLYRNVGSIPTGYKIRYQINTIGNYFKDEDEIIITPKFKYVDREGNVNENINLWSYVTDENNKSYLINLKNIKKETRDKLKTKIEVGDPYRDISEEEYKNTSEILNMTKYDLKSQEVDIGYADEIRLSKYLRIYTGKLEDKPREVDKEKVRKREQTWYGEYRLPDKTYVVDKDINLREYAAKNNGIDFKEDIFKKDGYILINFEIETKKDINSKGDELKYNSKQCNMFKVEGFSKTKTCYREERSKLFNFDYGDIIFFNPNRKMSEDYNSYGTH